MKPFRISTSINWARESYQRNILAFIALAAIVTILQFGQQLATDPISESFDLCLNAGGLASNGSSLDAQAMENCVAEQLPTLVLSMLVVLVFVLASFLATAGVIRGALHVSMGANIGFADTFLGKYFIQFLFTIVIIMIAFTAGLFLLVVPAFIALLLFQFAPFFALDRGYGPFLALKSSVGIVRKNWSLSILVLLVSGVAYLISGLFWGIPTIVALPIAALVTTYAYQKLTGNPVTNDPAERLE